VSNVATFPAVRPDHGTERDSVIPAWNEESRLLAAIRGGDRSAAEELVDRTYSSVFASLVRLCGDRELAADLTQETYRKAWEALPGFNGGSQFFTWLYRIGYTTFLNHIRRPRLMKSLDDEDAPEMPDSAPSAEEMLSDAEEGEKVRRAVLTLSEDLRFTVTAHFWGGLAVKEIAAIEEITTVAIRKRLHKAFTLLEEVLGVAVGEVER
jgi:RNA polymerase sigma factor (sigma-70 family)